MSTPNLRTAALALDQARPIVARLDVARNPEDNAADIIESWGAAETALRALLGGSSLGGQALIKELRLRELLDIDQAHALLAFLGARDRVGRTDYRPTTADVASAREGFQRLEGAVAVGHASDVATDAGLAPRPGSSYATPVAIDVAAATEAERRRKPMPILPVAIGIMLIAGLAAALWWYSGRTARTLDQGVVAYRAGRTDEARAAFARVARDDPKDATPHVYLARMARDEGNLPGAASELKTAILAEPNDPLALREMGAYLFTVGNYDLARRFYVRALSANPNDREAQGFLGCTMLRLGRVAEAQTFLRRAGQGPWLACTQQAAPPPGQLAPQPIPR